MGVAAGTVDPALPTLGRRGRHHALAGDALPNETTLLNFRHFLEDKGLTADITELPNLLRKDDEVVFGDAGYTSDEYKRDARHLGMRWCVNDYQQEALETQTEQGPVVRTEKAQPQTIVGAGAGRTHNRIIKCQFGFRKTRYHGLAKNARRSICTCSGGH